MRMITTTSPSFSADSATALRGYSERGYHIEPNLVPDEVCNRLISMAAAKPNALDGTFRPIPMPHFVDPIFMEMMRFGPIVDIVEHLVGGRASGLGGEYFYMRPGTPGFSEHQDNAYVQAPPDRFVSVWTALCDVGPENGGLIFYPGSHKAGALEVERRDVVPDPGQNPGAAAIRAILPAGFEPLHPRVRKGTVLFFHSHLVHASNPNRTTDCFRYSFLATYIKTGEPFRPGTAQKRREVELYGPITPTS
jgi:phytanoyl-CoA hydroxylase